MRIKYLPFVIMLIAMICLALAAVSQAYTSDSELLPEVLNEWKTIDKGWPGGQPGRLFIVVKANPDLTSPIVSVLMCLDMQVGVMAGYAYYNGDTLELYTLYTADDTHYHKKEPSALGKENINTWLKPYLGTPT